MPAIRVASFATLPARRDSAIADPRSERSCVSFARKKRNGNQARRLCTVAINTYYKYLERIAHKRRSLRTFDSSVASGNEIPARRSTEFVRQTDGKPPLNANEKFLTRCQ